MTDELEKARKHLQDARSDVRKWRAEAAIVQGKLEAAISTKVRLELWVMELKRERRADD